MFISIDTHMRRRTKAGLKWLNELQNQVAVSAVSVDDMLYLSKNTSNYIQSNNIMGLNKLRFIPIKTLQ